MSLNKSSKFPQTQSYQEKFQDKAETKTEMLERLRLNSLVKNKQNLLGPPSYNFVTQNGRKSNLSSHLEISSYYTVPPIGARILELEEVEMEHGFATYKGMG